jgi:hypothetical protein
MADILMLFYISKVLFAYQQVFLKTVLSHLKPNFHQLKFACVKRLREKFSAQSSVSKKIHFKKYEVIQVSARGQG